MKVLALAPYPESAPSTRFRVVQFQPALRELGVDLVLHPFLGADAYEAVRGQGLMALPAIARSARALLRVMDTAVAYDAVIIQRGMALLLDQTFLRRLVSTGVPILYDFDDAVFLPQDGGRWWMEGLRDPPGTTRALCRAGNVVLAGNRYLADYAREAVGRAGEARVRVLPSVVDTDVIAPRPNQAMGGALVVGWVGSDSTLPYLESLAPVLSRLATRVDYRLVVVAGQRRPQIPGVDLEFVRWSEADEAAVLGRLDVGLYPLDDTPWSRGKCGFKALQYLAHGVPCVAAPVGVLRDIVVSGETGILASTPDEWVDACMRLLRDPELRQRMGTRGRAVVEERYSVKVAAPMLVSAIEEAVF